MTAIPLSVELFDQMRREQDLSSFELTGDELVGLLSMYDPYGVWCLDIETGHVFWSEDVFEIHGLESKPGPVNLNDAINAYHPEDAKVIGQLIEDCIAQKSGFRFVLRLKNPKAGFHLVKALGRYRERPDGKKEIIGLFSRFALPIRSIASVEE